MLAAAAGVMKAHLTRTISPGDYGFDQAVSILAYAVLGGTSTWVGPIIGAGVLTALPELLRQFREYRGIVNGAVLLVVIVYLPGGLVNPAGWTRMWRRLRGGDRVLIQHDQKMDA
jgi:branched-chain amino acid transport system permease protein